MKGLIVKSPHIEKILDGKKTLEIRGMNTKIRGKIELIKSGSKTILGTVEIVDSKEITFEEYLEWKKFYSNGNISSIEKPYNKIFAWQLQNPIKYDEPKKYKHPNGAVTWVRLDSDD